MGPQKEFFSTPLFSASSSKTPATSLRLLRTKETAPEEEEEEEDVEDEDVCKKTFEKSCNIDRSISLPERPEFNARK